MSCARRLSLVAIGGRLAVVLIVAGADAASAGFGDQQSPCVVDPCPDAYEAAPGNRVQIGYGKDKGVDFQGASDCISLTEQSSIVIHRYVPMRRRAYRLQSLLPSGATDRYAMKVQWWKGSVSVSTLDVALATSGQVETNRVMLVAE